jgi:adenylate cyclase
MTLDVYLPQDRRRALAQGQTIPDRATGAALFADISGFTALTEQLRQTLGPRRGAEELTRHLDAVYTALIAQVERYGGSVIGFAGDAITCWFDDAAAHGQWAVDSGQSAASHAVLCGLALQEAIQPFHTNRLTLKVAIATGPARRLVVGDPDAQYLDTLAGQTVSRMAMAEQLAQKDEVVVDEETAVALAPRLTISEWRHADNGQRFAVVSSELTGFQNLSALSDSPPLDPIQLQAWLLRPVYQREQAEHMPFLTEFRPCAALFVRFAGIDYDQDGAQAQLDAFIRQAQAIAGQYEGTLLNLTIGDKGSYAYLNFGALSAHEDDGRRAVKTALALRESARDLPFLALLQMGVAYGVMRTGAYGGATRRAYSALGDDVNLAARLMATAGAGEILVSEAVYKAVSTHIHCEARPAVALKGKTAPVPVFAVSAERQRAIHLLEPTYALPMVGRENELQLIGEKLTAAWTGQAQIVGIVAEAGMGKSRLVAEALRLARSQGFVGYGGSCQSDGVNTPYLVWRSIWTAVFNLEPSDPLTTQIRALETAISRLAPERLPALPLLGQLLNLPLPDNAFTQSLEPKIRQSTLHALLEECLKTAVQSEPTLIILEDLHWVDALSHDLLDELAKALAYYPVCFMLAYRPFAAARLESLPHFHKIELTELSAAEAEQAIRAKLRQLYPTRGAEPPPALVEMLQTRSQGNPFYLEELLNYLRDRNVDPHDPVALEQVDLPDSLHALILSRIDQLSEQEKTTLRVASIIGRLFNTRWLTGYYPELGRLPQIRQALDKLHTLEITPLDSPEPELAYLFKHIVTHEVTYESLPFATRARLHEQLARYLETTFPDNLPLMALAFHYDRSDNLAKKREYLRLAGESAQKNYANEAAVNFYGQLLPLLQDESEQFAIHLQRGQVLELMGRWDDAESDYQAALSLVKNKPILQAEAQFVLGKLYRQRGIYEATLDWLKQAKSNYAILGNRRGLAQALIETGMVLWRKGDYAQAGEILNEGLALAREVGDKANAALALNNLGGVVWRQGEYATAQAMFEESMRLRHEVGDKPGVAASLNNLGLVAKSQGNYAIARELYERSLVLRREIGDKPGIASVLGNLGGVAQAQGDYSAAWALVEESLALEREIGDKWGVANSLNNLGVVAQAQGNYGMARILQEESLMLCREMGDKSGIADSLITLGLTAMAQSDYAAVKPLYEEALSLYQETGYKQGVVLALVNLGHLAIEQNDARDGLKAYHDALEMYQTAGDKYILCHIFIGLAAVTALLMELLRATCLLAITENLRERIGMEWEPTEKRIFDHVSISVRTGLPETQFQSAWAEGERMSLEEAVAYGLATAVAG